MAIATTTINMIVTRPAMASIIISVSPSKGFRNLRETNRIRLDICMYRPIPLSDVHSSRARG